MSDINNENKRVSVEKRWPSSKTVCIAECAIFVVLMIVAAFIWIKFYKITDEQAEFYAAENARREQEREAVRETP